MLAASGIPHAVLRNGWYWENYPNDLAGTVERGVLYGAAGEGKVAGAARNDYAEAAAVVLTTDGHDGRIYELGGDGGSPTPTSPRRSPTSPARPSPTRTCPRIGTPRCSKAPECPTVREILANSDAGIAAGVLDIDSGDLQKLIARSSTPVADVLRAALAAA